jgi:hypothetical protein
MRVEVSSATDEPSEELEIPWQDPAQGTRFVDLRENPAAVETIEPARENRALAGFLAAINSADSLFLTARANVWLENRPASEEACVFGGRVVFAFAETSANFDPDAFTLLLEKLRGLLAATETSQALCVRLGFHACRYGSQARRGFCASLLMEATGKSEGQAKLRWTLGLAHVQQAMLFSSRVLRQERGRCI